jgi:serine/threonine protein kinase
MPPGPAVLAKVVESLASVGKFQLAEISNTDFCTVYRATDPAKQKRIAVKITSIESSGAGRARALEVFRRERDRARKLDHPNIARLFTAGETGGYLIWMSEWLEGSSLANTLATGEPSKPWDIVDAARQIAAALDYAHRAGLVHHRLNPGNILIESDGTAKLMDFGVPPYPDPTPSASPHTATAAQYMAPEDLHGGTTPASNLFGMGAILFHLACGKPPLEPTSLQARLTDSDGISVPDLRSINAKVHPGIAAPIAKLLSLAPADRYSSGADAVRDLEAYAGFGKPPEEPQQPLRAAPPPEPVTIKVRVAPSQPHADAATAAATNGSVPALHVRTSAPIAPSKPETVYAPSDPSPSPSAPASKRWQTPALSSRSLLIIAAGLLLLSLTVGFVILRHRHTPTEPAPTASTLPADTPLPPEIQSKLQEQAAEEATENAPETLPATAGQRRRVRNNINRAPVSAPTTLTGGGLVISSVPDGAKVQIDGYNMCAATPCTVTAIPPGAHAIIISKEGYSVGSQTVQVVPGSRLPISFTLSPSGASVSVSANPLGGFVLIDGVNTNRSTPTRILVPHGTHTITVRTVGYVDATTTMTIRDGENLSFTPTLRIALGSDDIKQVGGIKRLFGGNASKDMGRVQVRTTPRGASVYVNGTALNKNTPADFALRPGEYDLMIQMPGYKRVQKIVNVDSGKKIVIEQSLERE